MKGWAKVLFLVLAATPVVQPQNVCVDADPENCQRLYKACQNVLQEAASDAGTQLQLQTTFYSSKSLPVKRLNISVLTYVAIITDLQDDSCGSNANYPTVPAAFSRDDSLSYWIREDVFQWSADSNVEAHMKLQTLVSDLFHVLEAVQFNVYDILNLEDGGDTSVYSEPGYPILDSEPTLSLELTIEELPCMYSRGDFVSALTSTLTWVKGYALPPNGVSDVFVMQEMEARGLVKHSDNLDYDSLQLRVLLVVLWAGVAFLAAVAMCVFMRRIVCFINRQISRREYLYSLYWGTAYTLGSCNCMSIIFQVEMLIIFISSNRDLVLPTIAIVIQCLLLPILELCVAVRVSKGLTAPVPKMLADVFCCCVWFSKCRFHSRMIHILALVNILRFVQSVLLPGIIVAVFFFILQPALTIAIVSLVMSFLLCAIIVFSAVAHSYKRSNGLCNSLCFKLLPLIFTTTLMFLVIITVILLYINLTANGLGTTGIGGILVALIPSALFLILGLVVRRKLLERSQEPLPQQEGRGSEEGGGGGGVQAGDGINGQSEYTALLEGNNRV